MHEHWFNLMLQLSVLMMQRSPFHDIIAHSFYLQADTMPLLETDYLLLWRSLHGVFCFFSADESALSSPKLRHHVGAQ
jgi:hypothetical protein